MELDIEVEDEPADHLEVLEGSRTVDKPDAEVVGHTFNKKSHVVKNLYFKMTYNFECDQEYVAAFRVYKNAQPWLQKQMLKYVELLEKTEKGIKAEFIKAKSGGARVDWTSGRQWMINQKRIVGFYNYPGEDTNLRFEPEKVDINRIWHPGRQDQTTWDCVPHAMNMLLGCAYVKERDQHLCL